MADAKKQDAVEAYNAAVDAAIAALEAVAEQDTGRIPFFPVTVDFLPAGRIQHHGGAGVLFHKIGGPK